VLGSELPTIDTELAVAVDTVQRLDANAIVAVAGIGALGVERDVGERQAHRPSGDPQ